MRNNLHLRRLMAMLCATSALAACTDSYTATDSADDALPPCTTAGTPFEKQETFVWSDANKAWGDLAWSDTYHAQVSAVIEEYRTTIGIGAEKDPDDDVSEKILLCTGEDYREVVPAGAKLKALAATLLPWNVAKGGAGVENLSAADAGAILLEYLREYECALRERDFYMRQTVALAMTEKNKSTLMFGSADVQNEVVRRQERIREEVRVARPALERTLTLLSGTQRLHPLVADIECIERASLDLRNAFSLLTGAASCMGRSVDARSPLRF